MFYSNIDMELPSVFLLLFVSTVSNTGIRRDAGPEVVRSLYFLTVKSFQILAVSSGGIKGATAYEVSGNHVDCVSLALSGALFAWSKPQLVIVGVNKGPTCGNDMFSSSAVAGARQALISGVPSLSLP